MATKNSIRMKKIAVFFLVFFSISTYSQDGIIDTSFNVGSGANGNVYLMKQFSDGKILLGGQFTTYNGITANRIARLNSDGTLDATFNVGGFGFDGDVLDAFIENDGKIVVVGMFGSYNGVVRYAAVKLNADGTIDTSFSVTSGSIMSIATVSKQNDKYIISGEFSSINGVQAGCIARLNSNGTTDTTFNSTIGVVASGISKNIVQNDGKIMIAGTFTGYNSVARKNIARLNVDGALDTTFNPGTGPTASINSLAIQNDGKYIIGGNFSQYNGVSKPLIARINSDGTLDVNFSIQSGFGIISSSIAIQNDGKLIVGGFTSGLGNGHYLDRLNSNGTFDTSFVTGTNFDNPVNTISIQSDGKILVGGWFSLYNSVARNKVVRLNNPLTFSTIENEISVSLYPNPTTSFLVIDSLNIGIKKIIIVDIFGKRIFQESYNFDNNLQLDFSNYKKGIYMLEIFTKEGKIIKKIIKD